MKIVLSLAVLITICCTFLFFLKKNSSVVTVLKHGAFTVKMTVHSQRKLNGNFRWFTETTVAYSVWYKNEVVTYSSPLQGNTGYSHLWRVYVLADAPTPTLIAGSQSLFMINEDNGKLVVTPLAEQDGDFATLQFLDAVNGQPSPPVNVYMTNRPDSVQTLKGGEYLLVNQRLFLHVPDLKLLRFRKMEDNINGYHFIKTGGAQSFSPDKKLLAFMGGKNNDNNRYQYAMITYDPFEEKAEVVPYSRTDTRSVDLNYDNRKWFSSYFEWSKTDAERYHLQLKKYDVLPPWLGSYKDAGVVYQLTPVKNEMQQLFANFILKELDLKKEDIHPGGQYSSNMMVIHYKNFRFNVWLRPEDRILVLMMKDNYVPEAVEGIKIIHQLGDHFNKALETGKYQEYFTRLKD